jgi:hypothetical protein
VDRCDSCSFVYADLPVPDIATRLRLLAAEYPDRLERVDDRSLRARPEPETWSALEYTCHVRDVFRVQRERVALTLTVDVPEYVPMGRDERVVDDRYNEQDVTVVLADLVASADELATALEALDDAQWRRTGIYSWPTRAERSLEWVGRHTTHEAMHHLRDIDRDLEAVRT